MRVGAVGRENQHVVLAIEIKPQRVNATYPGEQMPLIGHQVDDGGVRGAVDNLVLKLAYRPRLGAPRLRRRHPTAAAARPGATDGPMYPLSLA